MKHYRFFSWIALGILLYEIIGFGFLFLLYRIFPQDSYFLQSSLPSILSVVLTAPVLYLIVRKEASLRPNPASKQPMHASAFFFALCVMTGGQLLYSLWGNFLELGLECFGFTGYQALSDASTSGYVYGWSDFLYSAVFAPICEELVYRGYLLHKTRKFGRNFAIVISALLFGVMHGNFFQMPYAFLMGLILGYIASEYGLFWSILLHVSNNLILGEGLNFCLSPLSATMQDYIQRGVNIVFFALGAFLLLKYRQHFSEYIQKNKTEDKKDYLRFLCTIPCILFMLWECYLGIRSIYIL